MKKKPTARQIFAIIGVVVLLSLYIVSLILAIVGHGQTKMMFTISIIATIVIPIVIYLFTMFSKMLHRNDPPEAKQYADSKDDPYDTKK